jgi:tetratricopeptide (TPR) repeat protein
MSFLFWRRPMLSGFTSQELRRLGLILNNPAVLTGVSGALRLLQEAIEASPNEFVLHYAIADMHMTNGYYAAGVESARAARDLAPKNPRAWFAVAVNTRSLLWSRYDSPGNVEKIDRLVQSSGLIPGDMDPVAATEALGELGLTLFDAYKESLEAYETALTFNLKRRDRMLVEQSIAKLKEQFAMHSAQAGA